MQPSDSECIPNSTNEPAVIWSDAQCSCDEKLGNKKPQAGAWQSAPPTGLLVNRIDACLASAALSELNPHFQGGPTASRLAVEIGWTVDGVKAGRSRKHMVEARSPTDFPAVIALTREAMHVLQRDCKQLEGYPLNISCLKYLKGHSIKYHVDGEYYEEPVFGCVLQNTSDRVLQFFRRTASEVKCFSLEEEPGVCFLQEGDARYIWQHGVPKIGLGERISVTWRWFKPGSKC
eukprot:gnl/TRDRNA2_/TRDRNA2_203160_c0_seq1.p1 gnl/TRDRNA2_/TRDRNA2_203160_c0~~gnl/TRDRNA2_/TRDRNA2_203160_c0_seq1.p1  ORF type:complete len:233 (-),score=19.95 gnl/TRDRNA2_/TRDRNA2_203160_c0_seq1:29-727(-)